MLVALLVLAAGCASSGYDKGNKTAEGIQKAADRIAALSGQIDKTLASLNGLVEKPQADLRPQYKQFAADLAKVESSAKDIASARRAIGKEGKDFFGHHEKNEKGDLIFIGMNRAERRSAAAGTRRHGGNRKATA